MAGCDVEHAESGEEALELFIKRVIDQNPYSAVYMDIGLPKMNGIETCIAIRKYETEKALSPTPIIAVTGNKCAETQSECLSAGMVDVFDKPLSKDKVANFMLKCSI